MLPLSFPLRPGNNPPTPHGEGCFCCVPSGRVSNGNRAALPHFNYRIGTYGTIREWLLRQIDQSPVLKNWTHRAPDDPGIALLEGASVLGDILTFYQETYANEAFLRTAKWRESISDLVRLLGYRLAPGVGGDTTFAIEIKKDEPVIIPYGFPLKATLEELEKPAEFETTGEIMAYPWLSRFNLFRPQADPDIDKNAVEFYISAPQQTISPLELKAGDRFVVGEASAKSKKGPGKLKNAEIVIIDSIREQHGTTIFKIKGKLKRTNSVTKLTAYRLGRTFHHLGSNSPAEIVDPSMPVISTSTVNETTKETTSSATIPILNVPSYRPVSGTPTSFSLKTVSLALNITEFPIDTEVPDLPNMVPLVIQARFAVPDKTGNSSERPVLTTIIRWISDISTTTMTWGTESATVSMLQVTDSMEDVVTKNDEMNIRDALFHEVTSPLLTIRAAKTDKSDVIGNEPNFYGTSEEVKTLDGRRIMFEKPDAEPRIVKVTKVLAAPDQKKKDFPRLHSITLSEEVVYADFPNEEPTTTVFGNLVDADQGKTLPEAVLGSGDANTAFQNFKLPKAPLTYHVVPENTPSETPEAEIYVNGRAWTKVDSFFGRDADERIYIIREDSEGNSWVQFGDGKTGSRLTTGNNNVTAVYRIGSGAYGPLKTDTKVQASAKIKNLDKIGMPSVVTGGSMPEDGENARNAAPGKVQSLGRIVSLKDFESEASAISGVALASAAWKLVDSVPAAVVTVLMETGRKGEIEAVRETLSSYNALRGAARFSVQVDLGKREYVSASVQYALEPGFRADLVEPQIRVALGTNFGLPIGEEDQSGLFSVRQRRFGAREYAASVEGVTQNVDGVNWAKTVVFEGLPYKDEPASISLPPVTTLNSIVPCDSDQILSLYDKHLILTAVKGEVT